MLENVWQDSKPDIDKVSTCLSSSSSITSFMMQVTHAAIILLSSTLSSANVYTEPAIFERLCHFKNDGVVNHLNAIDQAMIADGACRMVRPELDGYALWHDPASTIAVIDALKDVLPPTGKPSHFVLTAHEVLDDLCPVAAEENTKEEYTCKGGAYDVEVMAGAMHNWQRALCAPMIDPEWEVMISCMQSVY